MSPLDWLAGAAAAALLTNALGGGASTDPLAALQSNAATLDEVAKQPAPVRHGPRARRPRGGFLGEFRALWAMPADLILEAYPAMSCDGGYCQITKPSRQDCLGDLPCTSLGLRLEDGKLAGLRMAIPSGVATNLEGTIRRSAIFIQSNTGPLNSPGCYARRTDRYRLGDSFIGFESISCSGLYAAMYGSTTTMILSSRSSPGAVR